MKNSIKTVVIENIYPEIDGGKFAVKREVGDKFYVFADVYRGGHESIVVNLKYRYSKETTWKKVPMKSMPDHRWVGTFNLEQTGYYEYTIESYVNNEDGLVSQYDKILEIDVNTEKARFGAWYEMWPRSQGVKENESATFLDMIKRLTEIKAMGFDVIYLTPIHPIGETNKKGANNSLIATDEDPGCSYSIGNRHGGHKAVEPTLGTIDDFKKFVKVCKKLDMDVALDIVLSCSPDHPYIKQHPDWFFYNEDGVMQYAENPPKKYEDTYYLNFFPKDKMEMWDEMVSIFTFWAKAGVQIFRVDNPHTKPVSFWEYCLKKVKNSFPDAIFLSEAFTHPKLMRYLAKIGFSQSYTYFTWRNTKWELISYLKELTQTEMSEYFRPNFFTNTPDILPVYLQRGGSNAFKIRHVLAATLSASYGIYNGFELCENAAIPGKEEYINSEKYQLKVWDWDREGNIKLFIKAINKIRKENLCLHYNKNLRFIDTDNDNILAYFKTTPDMTNIIVVVANLDPYSTHDSTIFVPNKEWNIEDNEHYTVTDLLSGQTFIWKNSKNYVKLNSSEEPVHIFKVTKWQHYAKERL